MAGVIDTSLADDERLVVERLVELMRDAFGERLRSVWLYGSRARGERPGPDSDVDLLAIANPIDDWEDGLTAIRLVDRAAEEVGRERADYDALIVEREQAERAVDAAERFLAA